jgi:hypothetical protein
MFAALLADTAVRNVGDKEKMIRSLRRDAGDFLILGEVAQHGYRSKTEKPQALRPRA